MRDLSRHLNATFIASEPGSRISGVYDRAIATPTGKIAVIRRQDTFTLAPWKPTLEPMRGQAVTGLVGANRVTWTLDRGRGIAGTRLNTSTPVRTMRAAQRVTTSESHESR